MTPERTRWIAGTCAGVVVLGIGGLLSWMGWSHRIADDIAVSWADRPSCTGTSVTDKPIELTSGNVATVEDVGEYIPMVHADPDMHCAVVVVVENNSDHEVHIDQIRAALLGPRSRAPVVAPRRVPYDAIRTDPDDKDSVLIQVDETLPAGERLGIRVPFDARPTCMEAGGEITYGNWPADVTALGREHRIRSDNHLKLKITKSISSPDC